MIKWNGNSDSCSKGLPLPFTSQPLFSVNPGICLNHPVLYCVPYLLGLPQGKLYPTGLKVAREFPWGKLKVVCGNHGVYWFLPQTLQGNFLLCPQLPFLSTFTCTSNLLHRYIFPGNHIPHLSAESKKKNWWDPFCAPRAQLSDTSPSRARNRHTLSPTSLPLHTLHPSSCLLPAFPLPFFAGSCSLQSLHELEGGG